MSLDINGYPSDEDVARIRDWPDTSIEGCHRLLDFVRSIWHPVYGGWTGPTRIDDKAQHILTTGGWSGNEEVIGALEANRMFAFMCAWRWERGGLYEYRIPIESAVSSAVKDGTDG